MRSQTLYVTLPICAAIVVAGTWLANAGSITPPAGPVSGTMVTLDDIMLAITTTPADPRTPIDILPYGIGMPGSYVVTTSLLSGGVTGITVSASNVTIDLGGFDLTGSMGGPGEFGIALDPGMTNVTILNGSLSSWGDSGIDMTAGGAGNRVIDVTVELCGGSGIVLPAGGEVKNCIVQFNEGDGIVTAGACRIVDSIAFGNGFPGGAGPGGGDGVFLGGPNNSLEGCVLGANYDDGVGSVFPSNSAHDCTAEANGLGSALGSGFAGLQRMTDCTANDNLLNGFTADFLGAGAVVVNCTAISNGADGFLVTFSHVSDSLARFNGDDGIDAAQCRIRDCEVAENGDNGIEGSFGNFITGNNCNVNAINGILIVGEFNTIENNHLVANLIAGVDTATASMAGFPTNLILSNRATANGIDYDLDFVMNTYGAIMVGPGPIPAGSNTNVIY